MKDPEELMFLRPDDLDEDERATLDAYLAANPGAAGTRDGVRRLADALAHELPREEGPPLDALLARLEPALPAPANRPWRGWVAAAALAAAALLAVVVVAGRGEGEGGRDRGHGGAGPAPGDLALDAVAEGPLGVRALADGDRVAADERVVFFAATRAPGELSLVEEAGGATTRVWPAAGGRWAVDVGRHAPGGDAPASWRPDRPVDAATYRARLCAGPEEAPPCVDAALRLRW